MKKLFPVCVIDDFYDDPYAVRELALSEKFNPNTDGRWPGARTREITEIDRTLFLHFSQRVLSVFYDYDEIQDFRIETSFQKIDPFSLEKENPLNRGFIHLDNTLFGGVIYLDLDYEEHTGTSIYTPKKKWWSYDKLGSDVNSLKMKKYTGNDLSEDDINLWDLDRNRYRETVVVENIFNRCVLFDGNNHHGVPFFGTNERLTQVFFVTNIMFKSARHPRYPLNPYNC